MIGGRGRGINRVWRNMRALLLIVLFFSGIARGEIRDSSEADRVEALIARMTPEEKAGQLTQLFAFDYLPQAMIEDAVAKGRVGSLLYVKDAATCNRLQKLALETSRLKIPLLIGNDIVHGAATVFPVPLALSASWDPALVEAVQAASAREARAFGIHWTFAPMLDIARDPRWGRIVESAGEDPYLGAVMGAAQVRGFQGERLGAPDHLIAGPKHFAGYGAALGGRDYDEVNLSDNELWNVYLPPFQAAVRAGAGNIMSAYMGLNGVPAAANRWLLTDVLRRDWRFEGFVVSDADGVKNLVTHGLAFDLQDAAARALNAGLDMEMAFAWHLEDAAFTRLPAALKAGQITRAQLDAAVRRVLTIKMRMGLFDNPYVDPRAAARFANFSPHRELARQAAQRSAVLLRNDVLFRNDMTRHDDTGEPDAAKSRAQNTSGTALLPLSAQRLRSIAVVGPLADSHRDILGPWVFHQADRNNALSVLAGIRAKIAEKGAPARVDYAPGVEMPERVFPSPFDQLFPPEPKPEPFDVRAEFDKAVTLAQHADVAIVVLGESQNQVGENASRSSLSFPGDQQRLLEAVAATGTPVVLVVMSARPLDLRWAKEHVPAILDIWYPGIEGGAATANLLFGDAVPGGRLPFNWPRDVGQVPIPYAQLLSQAPDAAGRRYWNEESTPLYPFGYGLSYAAFAYSNVRIDKARVRVGEQVVVSVDVRNTGAVAADETAQLYLHQRHGSAARPRRELKGFQRISLAPGETRTLRFSLGPDALRYWSAARRDWVLESSVFDVWVGSDSTAAAKTQFETL